MRWTRERVKAALELWVEDTDAVRAPAITEWKPPPPGMPSISTIYHYGGWNELWAEAGVVPNAQYVSNLRDYESQELQYRVDAGQTLAEIATELGITPQALGRRLARYRARHPEHGHYAPHVSDRRRRLGS